MQNPLKSQNVSRGSLHVGVVCGVVGAVSRGSGLFSKNNGKNLDISKSVSCDVQGCFSHRFSNTKFWFCFIDIKIFRKNQPWTPWTSVSW